MYISKDDLFKAANQKGLSQDDASELWQELSLRKVGKEGISRLAYWLGVLLVTAAVGWFIHIGPVVLHEDTLSVVSLSFIAVLIAVGYRLWIKEHKRIGGVLVSLALCIFPVAIRAALRHFGWWFEPDPALYKIYFFYNSINSLIVYVLTALIGFALLWKVRFPLLTAPIAFYLWEIATDAAQLFVGDSPLSMMACSVVSMVFCSLIVVGAYFIDKKQQREFAFWGYFSGTLGFSASVATIAYTDDSYKLLYPLADIGLIALSLWINQRVLLAVGAIGLLGYFSELAYTYFDHSLSFPIIFLLIGLVVIGAGVFYQRRHRLKTRE